MFEIIEWHKWPESKPDLGSHILAQANDGEFEFTYYSRKLIDGEEIGDPCIFWSDYNPNKHCYESREKDVIAWAYQLNGLNKDDMGCTEVLYMNGFTNQIIAYANKLREMFISDNASLDTNNGLCAAWILLKKYFPDLVKRIDQE